MGTTNKVKFGIKNCHYAVATIAANGSATYGTVNALPGAVSLSMDAQGDLSPFYADDVEYYVDNQNNGYSGNLELALIPDDFKKDVLGYAADANGVLYEDGDAPVVHFALLFEFSGDKHAKRHALYNCVSGRPSVSGSTKTNTAEPQTETLAITSTSIYNADLQKYIPKASVTPTETGQYNGWMSAVYQPTGTAATT